jgi:hypothetical protein
MASLLRHSLVLFLVVSITPVLRAADEGDKKPPLLVGTITVNAVPVFNHEEASHGSFYRYANFLHVQTRESLLQRFLLFRTGDRFDAAKLEETERNLRLFDFLTSASVTAGPPHDGLVDVAIVTQDAWTTDVNGDYSNDGGKSAYDFDITQKDLFGSGSELELHLGTSVERRSNTIEFLHPALFGPYWNLDTLYSKNSDGNEEKIQVDRPLFSYSTPWTASFLFDHTLRNSRYFQNAEVAARFRQEHRQFMLSRSTVVRADRNGSASIVGALDIQDDVFARLPGRPTDVIPDARHFRFFEAGYESTGFRFMKLDYVDRDLREQDFNLGRVTTVRIGFSPAHATWRLRAGQSIGLRFSDRSFLLTQLSATTRSPRDRNTIVSADLRTVTRFLTRYPQAFVARAHLDVGSHLDRDVQFLADGQNGLRAYPDFAFEGTRRFIINAEHRIFLGRELLQLFGPSLAFFVDSGQAVDHALRWSGMKTDAGIGLRIGLARFESAMVRVDFAWALNSSPLNRPGHVISISTVHAF